MRLPPLLALLVAASFGAAAACLLELDLHPDCGDNFVDERAGEDCEPAVPASYEGRCDPGQVATVDACDPKTCTFQSKGCSSCGNGVVDPGEQCDPKDMFSATCVGDGEAGCRDDCTLDLSGCAACGNGVVDLDEECDPAFSLGDIAVEIPCTELGSPYGPGRFYGSGTATKCNSQCEWDRSHCLYCLNKRLESDEVAPNIYVDFEKKISPVPEVCDEGADGEILYDGDELIEFCQAEICGSNFRVECAAGCGGDCTAFTAPMNEPDNCCTARGEDCPYDQQTHMLKAGRDPCCWAIEHPDDGDDPCENYTDENMQIFYVCR